VSQSYLSAGLYYIIKKSDDAVEIELTDASHPVFKAHFEGMPLLPGFLQMDIIAEILGQEIDEVTSAKFVNKILPNEKLVYLIAPTNSGVRVKLSNGSNALCGDFKLKWHQK
jgi:3-hydroxyacyl-[acyl-carrier-protein] dehydratase